MTIKRIYLLSLICLTFIIQGQNILTSGNFSPIGDDGKLYETSTIFFSTVNVTFTTFNIVRLVKTNKHKSNAAFGIIFGTAQTIYGGLNANSAEKNASLYTTINIGLGLTTILTSLLRLVKKSPPKENKVVFNFFYLPPIDKNTAAVGLNLKHTF